MKMSAVDIVYDVYEPEDLDPNACPIILTHGLFWNRFMYRGLADQLSNALKCTVYSIDLRNHGDSPSPRDLTIELMAADVLQFIRKKNLQRVNFVCHSISSSVAYLTLLAEPNIVEKSVMIDCPPFFIYKESDTNDLVVPQVLAQDRLLTTLDCKMSLAQAKSRFYKLATKGDKSQELFFKKAAHDLTKINGQFTWKIDLDYLLERYKGQHFVAKRKETFNHDVLIVRCENSDRITEELYDKTIKYNPRTKLVTMKNATHILMFERQDDFVEVVREYFSSPSDSIADRRTL